MDWTIYDERLFDNREKVKKLVRLKKKGTKFAKRIDVPFDDLVAYKKSIKTDLENAEEGVDVYTNFSEFSYRTSSESLNPEKYQDLLPAKFVDLRDHSQYKKDVEYYSDDQSLDEFYKANKLSINEQLFVQHYVACRNKIEAAEKAGYSPRSSRASAYKLMQRPKVQKAIAFTLAQPLKKFDISPERVIQDLITLRDRAMEGYPVKDSYGNYLGEWTCDYRNALKSIEMLGNYLGMFKQTVEHTGPNGGPIQHEIKYDLSELTTEELRFFKEKIRPKIKTIEVNPDE